jgi:hypothetical protein
MNWKGFGRKRSLPNFKVKLQFLHLSGGTEEKHKILQTVQPVPGPSFELNTSRTRSRSVNHWTAAFGKNV